MKHLFVFLPCEEADLFGIMNDLILVIDEASMNDLHVAIEELVIEGPSRA
jgi:hypothetical protein